MSSRFAVGLYAASFYATIQKPSTYKCDYVGDSRIIVRCRPFISWPEFFRFPPFFKPIAVAILALQDSIEFRVCEAQKGCGQREQLQRKLPLKRDKTLMHASTPGSAKRLATLTHQNSFQRARRQDNFFPDFRFLSSA